MQRTLAVKVEVLIYSKQNVHGLIHDWDFLYSMLFQIELRAII